MNAQEWREKIRGLGCCVCRHRDRLLSNPLEVHHVAEGSGLRSDYSVVCLCHEHHEGAAGLHGMGSKAFIRIYRPPGDSEYGLLVWTMEDLARAG